MKEAQSVCVFKWSRRSAIEEDYIARVPSVHQHTVVCTLWLAHGGVQSISVPGQEPLQPESCDLRGGYIRSQQGPAFEENASEGSHGAGSVVAPESQQRPMTAGKEQRLRVRPPRDRPYG